MNKVNSVFEKFATLQLKSSPTSDQEIYTLKTWWICEKQTVQNFLRLHDNGAISASETMLRASGAL
jgi:hypothetical protein